MKLNVSRLANLANARKFALAVILCASPQLVLANGVGNTSGGDGYQHSSGGVGVNVGITEPGVQPLPIPGITLQETPVEHTPNANTPSIHYTSQDDTHNPSPVVPGINYDPIGVVHDPSPVMPSINYAPRNVVHSPTPVLPGIQLGQTNVTHSPNIPVPSLDFNANVNRHGSGIRIPINLPNLNIDINGMISNVHSGRRGCRDRCGGGEHNTNVTVNINRSRTENNLFYRGGSTYYYVEDRTPTYTEFSYEEEAIAHAGLVPLRAVCVDGSGGVHPASQVFPDQLVDETYEGEIYRCVIGTSMQVTMGEMIDGAHSYQDGWTVTCSAGEALTYGNGEVTCTPQIERRPCNERSLLRRHGPGEKVVALTGMASRTESGHSTLAMDGGVGSYRRY